MMKKTSTRRSRRHRNPHGGEREQQQPFFSPAPVQAKEEQQPFFQPKLAIGRPGDKYEQEADAVAEQVVNGQGQAPAVQQKEISAIQRTSLATPVEDEKLGTAEARMEKDKLIQEKPEVQRMDDPLSPRLQRAVEEEEPVQMQAVEEEEPVQMMEGEEEEVQMQAVEEEEPVQMMEGEEEEVQMQEEEEEPVQQMDDPLSPRLQRAVEEEEVQAKAEAGGSTAGPQLSSRIKNAAGKGRPLPGKTRAEMGNAFGVDFSGVNIHTDAEAVQMNKALGAQAFTHGRDVYFNSGKYRPESSDGKRLLAHELTHVVQQGGWGTAQVQKKKNASKTGRKLNFITFKRRFIHLTGEDKYGHWWTEINDTSKDESYGWWPKYPVNFWRTIFGTKGELNGQTSFGGTSTKDPHHGDTAEQTFHPTLIEPKTDEQVVKDIKRFANSYSGEWRWTLGWGQNCRTFQKKLMKTVGLK